MKYPIRIHYGLSFVLLCVLIVLLFLYQPIDFDRTIPSHNVQAASQSVTARDLITMENESRSANGLSWLMIDDNIMKCAQDTADKMAYYHMNGHIGDVRNRISSFGYNNYYECWATENWWMGSAESTLEEIRLSWGDQPHMIPAENPLYCHIGAGIAEADDGTVYFVLQAAYPAFKAGCDYVKPEVAEIHGLKRVVADSNGSFNGSELIYKVLTTTPDVEGQTWHTVKQGQALWHIANAYGTTVDDLASWNHISNDSMLHLGQKLLIPEKGSASFAPTIPPTLLPTMNSDGTFRYPVKDGETIWSIAKMWNVDIDRLMTVNGLKQDSIINIGWKLWIPVTPTLTFSPTPKLLTSATIRPILTLTDLPPKKIDISESPIPAKKPEIPRWVLFGIIFAIFIGFLVIGISMLIRK